MDIIKDITYCYGHCDKQCERNLKFHDFTGKGAYSVSCYYDIRKGDNCEYFVEKSE